MLEVAVNGDRLSVNGDRSSVNGDGVVVHAQSLTEVQEAVRNYDRLVVRGGGSKPALGATREGAAVLDMRGLRGMVEYVPDEFTFTALAGTPLREVADMLAEHGQYLPFDPPLLEAGATLGGAVAAGLSGPRRYRYGGVRDFIIGVRFVDGRGQVVRGGGKVVKNAAGFDLPKLMVGSLGRLGALVELSFKVFPQPAAMATLRSDCATLDAALERMASLTRQPLDIEAIELEPTAGGASLWVRIGGRPDTLRLRVERLQDLLGGGERLADAVEQSHWREVGEFQWAAGCEVLVKAPLNARQVGALEERLAGLGLLRRYGVAGNVAWIALPQAEQLATLAGLLADLNLGGVVVRGPAGHPLLGQRSGEPFYRRVKQTLDPDGRFGEL
ncbi:MAG TPA: FAD-binding protein [Anaerolineae bacterium]|nr:FAD-binding protein [Anaerolineae bacterium]